MKINAVLLALGLGLSSGLVYADLEPYKDYTISDTVWDVSAIKVHPNMGDAYLENLKMTWVVSMELMKKLGQIEAYHIYRSDFEDSGSFNLLLTVQYKNNEMMAPNKARYDAFMKEWGAERQKKTTEISQSKYPPMRDIVGEYAMREITLK